MKTIIIRLPDVEAAKLVEVQKTKLSLVISNKRISNNKIILTDSY